MLPRSLTQLNIVRVPWENHSYRICMLNTWIDKFYVLVWIGKIMLPLGEEKLTLWLERSVEVHCEIIVWLLSIPHQLFRELTFKPVCFLMMYDLSACSATRAYDGNLLEDLFSWETGHKERQTWYIQAVSVSVAVNPKSTFWVENWFFLQDVKGQLFYYFTKEVTENS